MQSTKMCGGETGIRTQEAHRLRVFETRAFNHSAISPSRWYQEHAAPLWGSSVLQQ